MLQKIITGLLALNALTALCGGLILLADPSGYLMGLDTELLIYSPFTDFRTPGFILAFAVGMLSLLSMVMGIFKFRGYLKMARLSGLVLGMWLIVQIFMIREYFWIQGVYAFIAVLLFILPGFIPQAWNKPKENLE